MGQVGQSVNHRARAKAGELFQTRMVRRPADDHVNVLAEHLGEIGGRFALPPADLLTQKQRAAAQVGHRRLEADAGPHRRALEQERLHAAGQNRIANALGQLVFQLFAELEDPLDLGRRQFEQRQNVSHTISIKLKVNNRGWRG